MQEAIWMCLKLIQLYTLHNPDKAFQKAPILTR
jgi:hypothetical protein